MTDYRRVLHSATVPHNMIRLVIFIHYIIPYFWDFVTTPWSTLEINYTFSSIYVLINA